MLHAEQEDFKWELGYYSKKTDRIVVFETSPKIKKRPEEEAFKRKGSINRLDLNKVRISASQALKKCNELVSKKYSGQSITKKIIILQNIKSEVYNITLVSRGFNIINTRIDAENGKVTKHNMQSILSLGKWG